MNIKKYALLFMLTMGLGLSAQDNFHYTNFDFTQAALNPALAGGFEGTVRLGGLTREQDFGLSIGQFRTPIIGVDAPIIKGFRQYDWVGFGVSYQYSQAKYHNDNMVNSTFVGGLSYHFSLDDKRKNVIAIGVQSGTTSGYVGNMFSFYSDVKRYANGSSESPFETYQDFANKDKPSSINLGYTIGAVFTSKLSEFNSLKTGFAVHNVGNNLRVSYTTQGSGSYKRNLRFSGFGIYHMRLPNGLHLEPRIFVQYTKPSFEASIQTVAGLEITKPTKMKLLGGLGVNMPNGLQVLFGTEIKNLKVVFSFDLNLSDKVLVSGTGGALELGASYIFKIKREPNPDPVLLCPNI